jgi:succinylglutamate desuccinylase
MNLLEKHDQYVNKLKHKCPQKFMELGEDFWCYDPSGSKATPMLTISYSIHGNEVIGLHCATHVLEKLEKEEITLEMSIGFLLGNREAVVANKRFLRTDLNRSFDLSCPITSEELRAKKIEQNSEKNENFLQLLGHSHFPVIKYKPGKFSADGESFSGFCLENKIPFITLEMGEKGLDDNLVQELNHLLISLLTLSKNTFLNGLDVQTSQHIYEFYQESHIITKRQEDHFLIPGLMNLAKIPSDTYLSYLESTQEKFYAPESEHTYYALFPKYGEYQKQSKELVRLLKRVP